MTVRTLQITSIAGPLSLKRGRTTSFISYMTPFDNTLCFQEANIARAWVFLLIFCRIEATLDPSGYTALDSILGSPSIVPLVVEPASAADYATACPITIRSICPRITTIPLLQLDLSTTGPINLRSSSRSQLSSDQISAGAQQAFYLYNYDPNVRISR